MAVKFANPNTGYAVSVLYSGYNNIKKTTDAGATWIEQNSGHMGVRFMTIFMFSPDSVYMGGNFGNMIRTTNGGQNWVNLLAGGDSTQIWGLTFVNRTTGYFCGSYGRIKKTTDAGITWTQLNTPTQTSLSSIQFIDENTGYCSGFAIMLKTTNAGQNWINLNAPFISPFENFAEIVFRNEQTGYYGTNAGNLVKTTNGGQSWTNIFQTKPLFGLYFINDQTGYGCGSDTCIIKTTNSGANWVRQVTPATGMNNNEILTDVWFTDANTGFISTWYSKILKTTNGGITYIGKINEEIPEQFRLIQNYPNPFNPSTTIKFENNVQQSVKIEIYNSAGELVETLVNENLTAGTYSIIWNAYDKASGVYLVKMTSNSQSRTMKVILTK
jgi:photosystem II stability/assembly factor-like uncharacterized protein